MKRNPNMLTEQNDGTPKVKAEVAISGVRQANGVMQQKPFSPRRAACAGTGRGIADRGVGAEKDKASRQRKM